MVDVPLAAHVSRIVMELASRSDARQERDDGNVESDDSTNEEIPNVLPVSPESTPSPTSSLPHRRKPRVHRVGQTKVKRRRETTPTSPGRPKQKKNRKEISTPSSSVDGIIGGADPFGAFHLPKNSTTDMALHHWVSVFQNTRMAISPRRAWLKINLSDKTLLSVTTYCSAYHFYFLRHMRAPPACLWQKTNAIRNINMELRKPNSLPSDHMMVAVAVMTLLECLAGEVKECVIHRKGLQLMVNVRGGLENLGLGGAAGRTISWADTAYAILMRIKPTLHPMLVPSAGESPIAGFTTGDLKDRLRLLTKTTEFSKQIIYIWLRLRYLTEFLARMASEKTEQIDDYFFTDKVDLVERLIISLLHSEGLAESGAVAFFTAFLNASLIYIYEELRECPRWTNVCICLAQRIHSGLQMANLSFIARHCSDLLLWILVLGRSGNSPIGGEVGMIWYSSAITDMEDHLDIKVPKALSGLGYFSVAEGTRPMESRSGTRSGGSSATT